MNTIKEITDLADKRLKEAELLLSNGFNEGAFYLAGYSVELMLKARICKNLEIENFYLKPQISGKQAFFTHDLAQLLTLSGLRKRFENEIDSKGGNNSELSVNWQIICTWNEEKRYDTFVRQHDVEEFIDGITNPTNGFLTWLKQNW